MYKIIEKARKNKTITSLIIVITILLLSNTILTIIVLSKNCENKELETTLQKMNSISSPVDENSLVETDIIEPTDLFQNTKPEDNNPPQNSEVIPNKNPINFEKNVKESETSWKSDYINIKLPHGWTVRAYSTDTEDDQYVVQEIEILTTDMNSYVLTQISAFGITRIIPITFTNQIPNLDHYMSHDTPENELNNLLYTTKLNCSIKEEKVFCKIENSEYVDIENVRYVLIDDQRILILDKSSDEETYLLSDGSAKRIENLFYFESFKGNWSKKELETLFKSLETLKIK